MVVRWMIHFLATLLITISSQSYAQMNYVIGLTKSGIRIASVEEIEYGFNYELGKITQGKTFDLKIKVLPTESLLENMIFDGKLVGYFGNPLLLLKKEDQFNLNSIYAPVLNDEVMHQYVLLVKKESGITALEQLKGKKLGYSDADTIGLMFLKKAVLNKKDALKDHFFSKGVVKNNPNLVISSLFFNQVDAVIVLKNDYLIAAELNPQLKQKLSVIETSPHYVVNVLAVRNKLTGPMTLQDLEGYVERIGNSFQSSRLLKQYKYGVLRKVSQDDLKSVKALIRELPRNNEDLLP